MTTRQATAVSHKVSTRRSWHSDRSYGVDETMVEVVCRQEEKCREEEVNTQDCRRRCHGAKYAFALWNMGEQILLRSIYN